MKNMKKWIKRAFRLKSEKGVIAIIIAISLVMFIGFTALAVDVGYLMVTRNELQNVADASALAAARQLGWVYENPPYNDYEAQQNYVCDPEDIIAVVNDVAGKNQAGGSNITINAADVVIGLWDTYNRTLTPALDHPNAVRVTARRDSSANGPVTTFFAGVLGINTAEVSAVATAALTGQSTAGPGGLPFPAGISRAWFRDPPSSCDQPIRFYPTGNLNGCAGWHTYTTSPASARRLRDILDGLTNGTYQSPEATAGETRFVFTGGTLASAFPDMAELFDAAKVLNDGVIDADENPDTWTTSVVVYDSNDCRNPTGAITIVGFATVTITAVTTSPTNTIWAQVRCNYAEPGRGGGGNFGTWGTIPGLVE